MLAIGPGAAWRGRACCCSTSPRWAWPPCSSSSIFEVIVEINKQGTTVLLVEQNALMALEIANRGYVLGTGQVALADTAEALRDNEAVRKTYLGED